ncbi:MAG: site-specific DNA-methyltransferase [Polyangiaceae bacterium]|nr:site-specific DNA-methyltransferase [Polyangiaceae bacterium]
MQCFDDPGHPTATLSLPGFTLPPPVPRRALQQGPSLAFPPAEVREALAGTRRSALALGDAVQFLSGLPNGSIDLAITDPPYESLEKHRAIGTTTRLSHSKSSSNDWFQIFPNERFPELFSELYRVLKANSHLYLFSDQETMFVVKPIAERAGFRFWKPLVWDKQKIGMGYHYRSRYEFILFFEKGKRKLLDLSVPDVLSHPRIHRGYPTEKPWQVSQVFVNQSSQPGDLVLDPFMGSGSVGVAALREGRRFLGNDLCEEALKITTERLSNEFP